MKVTKRPVLPRAPPVNEPPRSREIGKAGTPSSYPKPARSKRKVSPEAAKHPQSADGALRGLEHQTRRKSHGVRGASARAPHATASCPQTRKTGTRKALVAGKTALSVSVLRWRPLPVSLRTSRIFVPAFPFAVNTELRHSHRNTGIDRLKRLLHRS